MKLLNVLLLELILCIYFLFLKILKHIIVIKFHHIYFFRNRLIVLSTSKSWHFIIKKINATLHKMLKLGFRSFRPIIFKRVFFYLQHFFCTYVYLLQLIFELSIFGEKRVRVLAAPFVKSKLMWYA